MSIPIQLESKGNYVSFHPIGQTTFGETANLVCRAVKLACEQDAEKLLVDISDLTGFEPPTTLPIFYFAEQAAAEATKPIKFALVSRPEMIRGNHYGIMIANHRGLLCEIFPAEPEALKWLLGK